jgi:FkbM family methyltransferase
MLKHWILNLARKFGLELRRYHTNTSEHRARQQTLSHLGIDLVLDVGANCGQFAEELMSSGYTGRVVSFEPLSQAHAILSHRCRAIGGTRWQVHQRAAIGAEAGSATIHVAGNSVSSSLLPTLPAHVQAAPESVTIGTEDVQVARLDDAAESYASTSRALLIKIDTQGFEWQVLDGAPRLLEQSMALQLELSLVPLYAGQRLWRDYVERLDKAGFQLYSAYPAFTDDHTGQTLQWDATFVRTSALLSSRAQRT